jgi:hypothetical protein
MKKDLDNSLSFVHEPNWLDQSSAIALTARWPKCYQATLRCIVSQFNFPHIHVAKRHPTNLDTV